MSNRTPAHVRRAELVAEASREVTGVLFDLDVQQLELADATARKADKVQRVCDPKQRETLSVVDVRMAREAGGSLEQLALELAAWQVGPEYAISRLPRHRGVVDDLRHLAQLVEQSGELAGHFAGAVADGRLSPEEAQGGIAHCEVLLETITSLRTRLTHALEQRGDTVRRIDGRKD